MRNLIKPAAMLAVLALVVVAAGCSKTTGRKVNVQAGEYYTEAQLDSLSNGDIQATHMLLGMPIASTMGLLGSPKKPMIVPWLLNRNGQAISLKKELKG